MQTQLTAPVRRLPVRQHATVGDTIIWIIGTGDGAFAATWDGAGTGISTTSDADTWTPAGIGTFTSRTAARAAVVSLAVAQ